MARTRNVNMRQVLSYELGPVPLSIASPDGGLAKTAKSKLLPLLERSIPAVEDIPDSNSVNGRHGDTADNHRARRHVCGYGSWQVFTQITSGSLPGGQVNFVVDQ